MKRRRSPVLLLCFHLWFHLQCLVQLYLCEAPFSKRLHDFYDAQRLHIKHGYEQVHATTASRVRNDHNLAKDDDAEATMSVQVCNGVELYQPTALGIE